MPFNSSPFARLPIAVTTVVLLTFSIADADDPLRSYKSEIIAKAQPDECFFDIYDSEVPGTGENEYEKAGIDCEDCITRGGQPKTNQSYVWGLTRKDNYLWWGTGPNVNRLVSGTYFGSSSNGISRDNTRGINFSAVEYGDSRFVREGAKDGETVMLANVSPEVGDWRPPDIFCYNLDTDTLERKDIEIKAADPAAWSLLWRTIGLRSAGYSAPSIDLTLDPPVNHTEGLVFLAGPNLDPTTGEPRGVSIFAFDAATRTYVAAKDFSDYTNIRKWKFYDGQLYTAIATDTGSGEVLRWVNDPTDAAYPFEFEVVGILDAGGAELEVHDDGDGPRLFVNTWPGVEGNLDIGGDPTAVLALINAPAGLWRSPIIPSGGLSASNANSWNLVWSVADYEPDLVIGLHYGGGAMASFDGHLYWGTMHVPVTSSFAHGLAYGSPDSIIPRPDPYPEDPEDPTRVAYEEDVQRFRSESFADFFNSYRSISIWRGKDFTSTGGDIDLLYGKETMPTRLKRSDFTLGNNPRENFDTNWTYLFIQNLGNLRNIADNQEQPYYTGGLSFTAAFFDLLGLVQVPPAEPVGRLLLEDGGAWNGGFSSFPEILAQEPNVGGFTPLWGPEGITENSTFYSSNNYTWTMQVFDGKLYIGTMDWDDISTPDPADGAHLYVIPSSTEPAVPVTRRGMANWSSYGIRTIAADDSRGELYLGMANVNNLLSTKVGDPEDGGWEVQRVTLRYTDDDVDELDDAWEISNFGGTTASADENSDSDWLDNYGEWLAGTDPNDPQSFFFTAQDSSETEGLQQIEWPTITGRYYTVYETEDLGSDWLPIATYAGTGSDIAYEYDPSLSTAKFFKVIITLELPVL